MASYDAARKYAAQGYPVLLVWGLRDGICTCPDGKKCRTPGKHPIHSKWTKSATTDQKKLKHLCERYPDAHLGIMPKEGSVIIDVDPRNGGTKTLKSMMNGDKLPTTPVQISGGGGMHIFLKGDVGPLGKGIDVKRPGRGFVVAAPADHISGGQYEWKYPLWSNTLAKVPSFLKKEEKHEEKKSNGIYKDDSPPPTVPLHTIRDALSFINADDYKRWIDFGHALKHAYGEEGEEIWVEWSKTSEKYEKGDEAKWETLDHNRDRTLITLRSIMSIARRNGYRPHTAEFDQAMWALGDISEFVDNKAKPVDWVFDPCIPAGRVTVIAGAGGSSKSYFTITLAMQLACGKQIGPFKPKEKAKALLVVAEEDKDDIHRRVQTVLKHAKFNDEQRKEIKDGVGIVSVRGLDWRLMSYDEAGNLQETDRVDYFIDEVRAIHGVKMIVMDPLTFFNGADENKNVEMGRLMATLDRIAEKTKCAVIIVHHVSKGGQVVSLNEATQAAVRGASALVDNARSALLMMRMPRTDAPLFGINSDDAGRFVVLRVVKNNYGPHVRDTIFAIESGGALRHAPEIVQKHKSVMQAHKEEERSEHSSAVLHYIFEHDNATHQAIADYIGTHRSTVTRIVTELREDGLVDADGNITKKGKDLVDLL